MKTCAEYEESISAYLDGELSGDGQEELMEHMASCPVCQRYFDDLVEIHAAMIPEETAIPEGFSQRIMEQVRNTPQDRPQPRKVVRFPRWKQWTALAACCALAVLGAVSLQRLGSGPSGQQLSIASYTAEDGTENTPAAHSSGNGIEAPCDAPTFRAARDAAYDEEPEPLPEAAPTAEDASIEGDSAQLYTMPAAEKTSETSETGSRELPAGTITAGGEEVRQWVEEELGLAWEPGQLYPLGAAEYAGLLTVLAETGADFTQEPGEGYWLLAA